MSLKEHLQDWMIKHHRNPYLLRGARIFYWAGLRLLVLLLQRHLGVSAVMLRRGMTRKDWIPGGSDYDLTIIAKDASADQVARKSFLTLRRFGAFWPVPAELSVFNESEMKSYLDHGNLRSLEAVKGWKALFGKWSASPRERKPIEIALHAFSEAMDQFSNLTELLLKPDLSRAETRHFLKYFVEAQICCEIAVNGRFENVPSRGEWLQKSLPEELRLKQRLLQSMETGFSPLAQDHRFEAWVLVGCALHRASQLERLKELTAAWELFPLKSIPPGVGPTHEFWSSLQEHAQKHGIALSAVHSHNRLVLVVSEGAFTPELYKKSAGTVRLLRLASIRQEEPPLILSESALRIFSSTATYQQQTFYSKGIHWNIRDSHLYGVNPISHPLASISLRSKMCTLPSEIRRARVLDPQQAAEIENGYLQQLFSQLSHDPDLSSGSSQ